MPIHAILDDRLEHTCAVCSARHKTTLADLMGAAASPAQAGEQVIALPPCRCGAHEFLVRSSDQEPPHPSQGSYGHLHQLLVDLLWARIASDASSQVASASAAPTAAAIARGIKRWFPDGLRLEGSAREEGRDP